VLEVPANAIESLHPREVHRERSAARKLVAEYYRRYPKDLYQTEVERWRDLQSANIEEAA
jgi:hypothetical protein